MGNWRNHPSRRRFYNQDRRPTKSYYDPQPPSYQEYVNDGVPLWEKEFCYNVGGVPWHRVVDAKDFSFCQSQILKWDDSAGEEAFHNAKTRYWAVINDLPCDIPRPNPDECIDEIDWNPYIDPELIRELEQEYFAPDEDESNYGSRKKKTRKNLNSESCSVNPIPRDAVNPWESQNLVQSSLIGDMKGQGWEDKDSKDDNPWEKACHEGGDTAWGVAGTNSWGWNPGGGSSSWEGNREAAKCNKWDDVIKWNDRASWGQKDGGWRNNSSNKGWRRKQWDDAKASEYRKPNEGWGSYKRDSWRNEDNKTYGFEGNDYEHWRGGTSKKRVSFGYS
ncbi:hypothetical protein LINGRAHAP2_LOCUS30139 [Linum grandiflorum]